jgi:hypothetical protein
MFSKRLYTRVGCILAFCLLMSLLGACSMPSDEPCTAEEIQYVTDPGPFYAVVDTLTPVLTWTYPDPSCHPDHYHITIFDRDINRYPNDFVHYPPVPVFEGETESDGTYYSVPASAGLQPGETYFVKVAGKTAGNEGHSWVIYWFSTGPSCTAGTSLQAPELLYPPDGAQMYFPDTVDFEWENQMTCYPAGDFYLEISRTESFAAPIWWGTTHHIAAAWISDGPPMFSDCTRYFWRVRADPAGGGEGAYSETRSFVLSWSNTFCPLDLGPWITPIPHYSVPIATVIEDAACWSGPSLDYSVVDFLPHGQQMEIQGRDQWNVWWYVDDPVLHKACWVYGEHVEVSGDLSQVPVQQAPPVPTHTPVPRPVNCGQYTNPNACGNNSSCWWDPNDPINTNGSCKSK